MDNLEQLQRRQQQYVDSYYRVLDTYNAIVEEIKLLNSMIEMAPSCYQVDDTNFCGNYLRSCCDKLVYYRDYMSGTVLPQTINIIKNYSQAISDAAQQELGG